jgi:hypothetical protein
MRNLLNSTLVVLIPVAVFFAVRRIGLTGGGGLLIIFVTCAVMCVWAAKQEARAGRLKLQNGAASFGFLPADRDEVDLCIYPLRGDGWVEGAASGELRGLKTWIFDYFIPDRGRSGVEQTVVAFDVEDANLPIFQIRPLGLGTRIGDGYGDNGETICFPDASQFQGRFELISSAEEGVRRHFSAKLLDTVAALNDCNCVVQGFHSSVLFFMPNKTLRPAQYEAFARKGADVAYALFSSEKSTMAAAAK